MPTSGSVQSGISALRSALLSVKSAKPVYFDVETLVGNRDYGSYALGEIGNPEFLEHVSYPVHV